MANDNVSALLAMMGGSGSGSGGSVTPASIVTATGQMTSQQAADTLDNIGGEPKGFVVKILESGGTISADKSYSEIFAAVAAEKKITCYVPYNGYALIVYADEHGVLFAQQNEARGGVVIDFYNVNSSNVWTKSTYIPSIAPTSVTDTSSTSITLASAADNTIYNYGELTALTITAITINGDFIIRFTSGATATTLTVPNTMKFPESFVPEANTRYEINCSNGYALVAGWPTA